MSKTILTLVLTSLLFSCGDEENTEKTQHTKDDATSSISTYFISADSLNSMPLETLKGVAQMTGQPDMVKLVNHGVTTYKLTYNTVFNDRPVKASGLIFIPQQLSGAAPLISLQHGTTFVKADAPSNNSKYTGMEFFASAGYVAIMPDYIGYGESSDIFHPYYDKTNSARAVIDMIKAAKEFLFAEKIILNEQLFLAGYSEGGYVTLATAQEIEENTHHNLTVTAVAAGAGGYDLIDMLSSVTTNPYYSYPAYLAFVLMSYNNTYEWKKPLTYFFQPKYATALATVMNGEYEGWQINNRLTTSVKSLLNPDFLNGIKTENGEPDLKNALLNNSVSGWKTSLPIRLYHGTKDEIIPYQNSELTLQNFKQAGSTNVELTLISGGTHGSAFVPMLQGFVPWFESLRK